MVAKMKKNNKNNNVIPFIADGDFYFSKGVDAFYKRKFDIALKWLKKATEANPKEALYSCQMSIIYTEIGAYHAANQILTEVIKEHGDHYFDCYYLIANNYAHLGLMQDAQKNASLYLQKDPDGEFKTETEQLLMILEAGMEEEFEEDDWLEEEDELLIFQETVFYHLERYEWEKALPLLEEMIMIFPEHLLAKHEYSYALFFSGRESEALEREENWLAEHPNSISARSNLAIFYYNQGKFEQSAVVIDGLKNVYPIHAQQCLRIAFTFAYTQNYSEAWNRFLRIPKSKVKGHMNYYRYYSLTVYHYEQKDKALQIWQEGCRQHAFLRSEKKPWE